MAELTTRPFERADVAAASALLAARHCADRAREPLLPARFESPDACAELVREATDYADGVVAERDGALGGFLFGVPILRAPDHPSARFQPLRACMMFAHGHAVAASEDPFAVTQALYAALGDGLVRRGIFAHLVHLASADAPLGAAWSDLGFGRWSVYAARDLAPLPRAGAAGVVVREATAGDIALAARLADEEVRFHARAPIWHAYLGRDTAAAARREIAGLVEGAESAVFLASRDGREVGVTAVSPAAAGPLFTPDRCAYLGQTAVLAEARGQGTGAALVGAALGWARERGYAHATLHFSVANALSRSFWTGLGFRPVLWHMLRLVDERAAWARPPGAQP